MRTVVRAVVLLVVLTGCDGDAGGPPTAPQVEKRSTLASVPIRKDEAPDGLAPDPAATGPIGSIAGILPPRSRFPDLPPVPSALREGFREGFERAFSGRSMEVTSSVVRFADPGVAASFLAYLERLPVGGNVAAPEQVDAPALGDEGYGWHLRVPGSEQVPAGESSGFVWRSGDLVATLTLTGPIGGASPEAALSLAQRVDARLS